MYSQIKFIYHINLYMTFASFTNELWFVGIISGSVESVTNMSTLHKILLVIMTIIMSGGLYMLYKNKGVAGKEKNDKLFKIYATASVIGLVAILALIAYNYNARSTI